MKTRVHCLLATLFVFTIGLPSQAVATALAYQGRLDRDGRPADGFFDLRFELHSAPTGDDPAAPTVTLNGVGVTNGAVDVLVDFDFVEPLWWAVFSASFGGGERWLAVAARPSGDELFVVLSPRQSVTPAPSSFFAGMALSVAGASSNALHSAGGDRSNVLFVDGGGAVGIGTTNPSSKLHVVSEPSAVSPPQVRSAHGGGGFSAGWDFHDRHVGKGYVGVPDVLAPFAPGELLLFGSPGSSGTSGSPVSLWSGGTRALTASTAGTVGIGTPWPLAAIEVHGDLRLGGNESLQVAGGDEALRLIRGVFTLDNMTTTIVSGQGFSVTFPTNEFADLVIQFSTPFAGQPTITASAGTESQFLANLVIVEPSTTGFTLRPIPRIFWRQLDRPIHFLAVGPR